MDSLVARPASQNGNAESPHMRTIKEAFRASVDEGFEAGLDVLLRDAREDCEFRPYIASNRVLRGHDEIRRYYGEAIASGTDMKLNPTSFHESGDDVVVARIDPGRPPHRRVLGDPDQLDLQLP